MRKAVRHLRRRLLEIDWVWFLLDRGPMRLFRSFEAERRKVEADRERRRRDSLTEQLLADLFPDRVVRHGPFAGMRYGRAHAIGSEVLPKLLGSYESEIHDVVEEICERSYSKIVNVGCAEGYYAVGLALRIPSARVYAYDVDSDARRLCRAMAKRNGVDSRVTVGSEITRDEIAQFGSSPRTLFVVDCEGCEAELLTAEVAQMLWQTELLIETHDFVDPTISDSLRSHFEQSHEVKAILSIPDTAKTENCAFQELDALDPEGRSLVLRELRPGLMRWLYMTPTSEGTRAQDA